LSWSAISLEDIFNAANSKAPSRVDRFLYLRAAFYVDDALGYLGLAILLFLIVYFLIGVLTHRSH